MALTPGKGAAGNHSASPRETGATRDGNAVRAQLPLQLGTREQTLTLSSEDTSGSKQTLHLCSLLTIMTTRMLAGK